MAELIHSFLGGAGMVCAGRYIGTTCAGFKGWRAYASFVGAMALGAVWYFTGVK